MGLGGREEGGVGDGMEGGDVELEHHFFQGLPRHGTYYITDI